MLKNRRNVRKIRNIAIVLIAIILVLGIYIKFNFSHQELEESAKVETVKVETIVTDTFGYMEDEQFVIEAEKIDNDLYEIELPRNINTKEVNNIIEVTLENTVDTTQENISVNIVNNKIKLTKEQIENYKINLDAQYNAVIKQKQQDGTFETIELSEKSNEEIQQLEITDETEILYEKTLKHEEQEDSSIELEGKMPEDTELKVEKISEERIKEIFGNLKIEAAYDIKLLKNGTTEIDPEDFGETLDVSINDSKILEDSKVYHVKDDNTFEQASIIGNTEGNISFEAKTFSIYAVSSGEVETTSSDDDEMLEDEGTETGLAYQTRFNYTTSAGISGSVAALENGYPTITVPAGGYVTLTNKTYGSSALCISPGDSNCQGWHVSSVSLYAGYYGVYGYGSSSHSNGSYAVRLSVVEESPPKVTVNTTSCSWRKTGLSIKITVSKGSNSLSSASYQYYLSKSSTSLTGGSWKTYTSGTEFTLNPGSSGTYYLFVKRVSDTSGNYSTSNGTNTTVSSTTYHRYGAYKFDYTSPTAGTMTMKYGSSSGSTYSSGTWTNQSVYVAVKNGSDSHSGHSSTTYSVTQDGSTLYSNITAAKTLTSSGKYTITVTTTDNVGNTGTRTYYVYIDKNSPTAGTLTMKYGSSSGSTYTSKTWTNQSVYIALSNGSDSLSGHKSTKYTITKDGSTYSSNQTSAKTLSTQGKYTIVVTTTDNAGNTATNTYYVYIDKTAPTSATLTMKLENSSGSSYTRNNKWNYFYR